MEREVECEWAVTKVEGEESGDELSGRRGLPYPAIPCHTLPYPTIPYCNKLFHYKPYYTLPNLTVPYPTFQHCTIP